MEGQAISSRSVPPTQSIAASYSAQRVILNSKSRSKVNSPPLKRAKRLYPHNDSLWIKRAVNNVYQPHGLPKEIAQLPTLIRYTDGLQLRKICDFIRANQWAYICEQKLQFREGAWEKMRIEHIRPKILKENFINTFSIYLPYKSHLPINDNRTVPTASRNPI